MYNISKTLHSSNRQLGVFSFIYANKRQQKKEILISYINSYLPEICPILKREDVNMHLLSKILLTTIPIDHPSPYTILP
jgi:hypothetical protein